MSAHGKENEKRAPLDRAELQHRWSERRDNELDKKVPPTHLLCSKGAERNCPSATVWSCC